MMSHHSILNVNKGHWTFGTKLFERILLACWCLSTFVLVNAYSSLLISFLTIPTLKPVAKSFDDVSFRNVQGLRPIVGKNTMPANMIAVAVFMHSNTKYNLLSF